MPELPEVETVARDLRPRILGATIVGARCSWARTLRTHTPEAFAEAVAGRRVEAVWRRAKQIVIDLSGDAALTIHLKMTGQLFVVPAETPEDPYVRLVLELADGREIRFRDIRKFGKIGLYGRDPVTGELVTEVGGGAVFAALGPEPLDSEFSVRDFRRRLRKRSGRLKPLLLDQSFIAGVGNIYADEALWAARLHPLRTAGTLRPADERHLYERGPADPGRGGGAARQLDRRLHGARRRRLDAGAPAGLSADRGTVSALRAAGQADRHRRAIDAFLLVVPAPRRSRSEGCRHDPAGDDGGTTAAGRALDRPGRRGVARADRRGSGARVEQGTDRANETGRRDAAGGRPSVDFRVGRRRIRPDEHPPPVRGDPRGRHVRHPRFDRRVDRARRPDRAGRPERGGQDDAPPPGGRS